MTTTANDLPPLKAMGARYLQNLGKLKLWSGILAHQSLEGHNERQRKNQEAEDRYVRQAVWKAGDGASDEAGDMGHTILGDVTNPTPIVINSQPQSGGLGKVLAGAAIAAGLMGVPAAGIGGYLLNQYLTKQTPAASDETVDIGLLKLSDLIKKAE